MLESLTVDKPWLMLGDCLERMAEIPDGSVDMILCDLPYGTTACKWDEIIDFSRLWKFYMRILVPKKVAILTSSQPFTSALIMSNLNWFKYSWVWDKGRGSNHLNAKFQPMKSHEDICVFSQGASTFSRSGNMPYYPQMRQGQPYSKTGTGVKRKDIYRTELVWMGSKSDNGDRYPVSIIQFQNADHSKKLHCTQKPVPLMEYLIKTYTSPGEIVLDNCFGSGTTGVACVNTGRRFIGIERDPHYFDVGRKRIDAAIATACQPTPLGGLFDSIAAE